MISKIHAEIKSAHLELKKNHTQAINQLSKDATAYAEGAGGVYVNAKSRIIELEEKIEDKAERIQWLKDAFKELLKKSGGDETKDVKNVQREKTDAQEIMETLSDLLKDAQKDIRAEWMEANDLAHDLRLRARLMHESWVNVKVHEALSNCPYELIEAMALDGDAVQAQLDRLVRERKAMGPVMSPDIGDVPLIDLLGFNDEAIAAGARADQLRKLIALEKSGAEPENQQELRRMLKGYDGKGLACPPGGV